MANINTIKEASIQVYPGMIVVYPLFQQEDMLDDSISFIATEYNNCYSVNNSVICYVCNNQVYVTPYTIVTINVLDDAGYRQSSFYVPFSNCSSYPKLEEKRWKSLCKRAN